MDIGRLHALGWRAATPLKTGLEQAYADYRGRPNPASECVAASADDQLVIQATRTRIIKLYTEAEI